MSSVCSHAVSSLCSNVYNGVMLKYVNGLLNVCQAHHRNITVRSKTFALEVSQQMLFKVLVVIHRGLSSFKKKCAGQLNFSDVRRHDFPECSRFFFSAKASRCN